MKSFDQKCWECDVKWRGDSNSRCWNCGGDSSFPKPEEVWYSQVSKTTVRINDVEIEGSSSCLYYTVLNSDVYSEGEKVVRNSVNSFLSAFQKVKVALSGV